MKAYQAQSFEQWFIFSESEDTIHKTGLIWLKFSSLTQWPSCSSLNDFGLLFEWLQKVRNIAHKSHRPPLWCLFILFDNWNAHRKYILLFFFVRNKVIWVWNDMRVSRKFSLLGNYSLNQGGLLALTRMSLAPPSVVHLNQFGTGRYQV